MFLIRWFGLDTIACVISIQLFLGRFRNGVDGWLLSGLCCAVSMVYIVDRYRDLMVGCGGTKRHLVYQGRFAWVFMSVIGLGIGAFLYWLALAVALQLILVGCAGVFGVHVWLLRFGWYQWVKDWVVASVFSVVMMVGYFDLVAVGVLIGVFTVFNLTVHRLVENGFSRFDWVLVFGLALGVMGLVWFNTGLSWLFVVWLGAVIGQLGIVFIGREFRYWYELGELMFLVPFLFGGVLF